MFNRQTHTDWAANEADKERVIKVLTERGIEYLITNVDVPKSIAEHDGQRWTKDWDEAVLYINGIGKYNPSVIRIGKLKEFLDSDWRWRQERNSYEQKEILLNLREKTIEKEEDLVRERADIVEEINQLERELNV